MATVKLRYYVVKNGNGFWQPASHMRATGAKPIACGPDGPAAWSVAKAAFERWKAGIEAEAARMPKTIPGTIGAAFERYRSTIEWAKKPPRTREEWERCWVRIEPFFGRARPSAITLEHISMFRETVRVSVSEREAQRCIKIWRAIWKVAAALKFCRADADLSIGVRNTEPKTRSAVWEHAEVIKLAKTARRTGYKGLAAIIAVSWDTSLSPVDVRSLTPSERHGDAFHIARAKTRAGGDRDPWTARLSYSGRLYREPWSRDHPVRADLPQSVGNALLQRHARR